MINFIDLISSSALAEGGILASVIAIIGGILVWLKKFISKNQGTATAALALAEDVLEVAKTYDKAYEDKKLDKAEIKELGAKIKEVGEGIQALREALKNRK